MTVTFVDAENVAMEWALATTAITAAAGTNTSGNPNVYLGMPAGSPLPALTISRSGGSPSALSNLPVDYARVTMNCWGAKRADAKTLAEAVISAAQSLNDSPVFVAGNGARLHGAQVLLVLFLPDLTQAKPVPRYVVDVQFTIIAAQ